MKKLVILNLFILGLIPKQFGSSFELCSVTPNDTYIQSNENRYVERIELPKAWDICNKATNSTIGIIDNGIKYNDIEIANNIDLELCKCFIPNVSYYGHSMALSRHGTDIAFLIGGIGNNSYLSAGVTWNCNIAALKYCFGSISSDQNYDLFSQLTEAIEYATLNNIDFINISSRSFINNEGVYNALLNYDGLIICCSGNDSLDVDVQSQKTYPGCYSLDNIITVNSSNANDECSDFSNYGLVNTDIFAPGEGILFYGGENEPLRSVNGTSFAAPLVTGTLALMKEVNPTLSNQALKNILLSSADYDDEFYGKCTSSGRLNVYNALKSSIMTYSPSSNGYMELNTNLSNDEFKWIKYYGSGYKRIEVTGLTSSLIEIGTEPLSENIVFTNSCSNSTNSFVYDFGSGSELFIRIKNTSTYIGSPNVKITHLHGSNNHVFTDYDWVNNQKHLASCVCGHSELKNHVISSGGLNPFVINPPGNSICLLCGGPCQFGYVIEGDGNNQIKRVGYSSYQLPNGDILIGDYDCLEYFYE